MVRLSQIKSPEDIKLCSYAELKELAEEIRQEIISTVAQNGGHLASNLGVVELTIAVHRMFQAPEDKILFDVGHQSYVHKLLTGRYDKFRSLRCFGGMCGFPKRDESPYDCFETGHASTAISAALGFARARDLKHQNHQVVAIVGDGALTGGMCYEALNDAGSSKTHLIVILNDNKMSISPNVGALARHLTNMRASRSWNRTKKVVEKGLRRIPVAGPKLHKFLSWFKNAIKWLVVDEGFFAALGFHYLGPIDGHDLPNLEYTIARAKELNEPVLIHCITQKGHGYQQAENKPEIFHGVPPFIMENGDVLKKPDRPSYGEIAAEELVKMAAEDERIAVITAAMPSGTGMEIFGKAYPERMFDVGIAEQHAATLSAGLASGGMKPYFAVYATFMQRAYDQMLHDICLQNLPVCLLLDRAGLAGEDGATHQGLYDIAYLRHIPNVTLLAPRDEQELKLMLAYTRTMQGPCAIRYPRKSICMGQAYPQSTFIPGKWEVMEEGKDCVMFAVGAMVPSALETARLLREQHIHPKVVNASTIKPLDSQLLADIRHLPVITLEEHALACGFGSAVSEFAAVHQWNAPVLMLGIPDVFVPHGSRDDLLKMLDLTPVQMAGRIAQTLAALTGDRHDQ